MTARATARVPVDWQVEAQPGADPAAVLDTTAKASKKVLRQVQQGIAGIGQAVSALGAAQKAQAKAAYDVANATVAALTLRAPIAGVVQFARPSAGTSTLRVAMVLPFITSDTVLDAAGVP